MAWRVQRAVSVRAWPGCLFPIETTRALAESWISGSGAAGSLTPAVLGKSATLPRLWITRGCNTLTEHRERSGQLTDYHATTTSGLQLGEARPRVQEPAGARTGPELSHIYLEHEMKCCLSMPTKRRKPPRGIFSGTGLPSPTFALLTLVAIMSARIPTYRSARRLTSTQLPPARLPVFRSVVAHPPAPFLVEQAGSAAAASQGDKGKSAAKPSTDVKGKGKEKDKSDKSGTGVAGTTQVCRRTWRRGSDEVQ